MFAFLTRRSPKGGNAMRNLLEDEKGEKNIVISDVEVSPEIAENFYCTVLGYADRDLRKGDKILIRPNELATLKKILDKSVEIYK
jgi:hypothetical protein